MAFGILIRSIFISTYNTYVLKHLQTGCQLTSSQSLKIAWSRNFLFYKKHLKSDLMNVINNLFEMFKSGMLYQDISFHNKEVARKKFPHIHTHTRTQTHTRQSTNGFNILSWYLRRF